MVPPGRNKKVPALEIFAQPSARVSVSRRFSGFVLNRGLRGLASGALADGMRDRIGRRSHRTIDSVRHELSKVMFRSRSISSQRSDHRLRPGHPPDSSPRPRCSSS
jgi:hypothetical protein